MPRVASDGASGVPTEVLVAPDSFKGTHSAAAVAAALRRGLVAGGQPAAVCPLADGGEGTVAALADALELEQLRAAVSDPLGREREASFGLTPGGVAVVEMAAASGLPLVAEGERDAITASSYGTGELIAAAIEAGARTVYVAAGGSATTDGGAAAIEALEQRGGTGGVKLVVLCDVRTPFELAATTFAPQKGASREQVHTLERRLDALAGRFPRDPRGVPMTGAAGGLAGGLWARFDAELVAGAAFVLAAVDFDVRMRAARAVVTGEGRLDRQSLVGKLTSEVATRARQAGVPCHAVVGSNALDLFDLRILDLQLVLEASTLGELEAAGAELGAAIQAETAAGR
ncbi:MAG TPA: glycerate kinase [Solirubrobacteraceae bacterium]|nr:glycerate kinase [Solirubrobacteraceae bacterium]